MRPGARVTAYRLRIATAADAEAICRIYNEGIEDRVATLETELRTPDERRQWLASRSPRHPVIVAELTDQSAEHEIARESSAPEIGRVGATSSLVRPPSKQSGLTGPATTKQAGLTDPATIIAWASLNVFNAREAYRFVADISVYVERSWRGKGAGGVLLEKLIELGRQHGFHKLVLAAFPSNTGGMALYEKLGFRTVGIYREQGLLDGQWVDTIVMERLL
jgi:L-amino acid N-acyltransferase YncA